MKNIIQFVVAKEKDVYTADGVNVPVVTQGSTFEELQSNIREAVALYFENEDAASLGFSTSPAVLTNFELSPALYQGRDWGSFGQAGRRYPREVWLRPPYHQ